MFVPESDTDRERDPSQGAPAPRTGGLPPSKHTDCRTGAVATMSSSSTMKLGGDEVTFVPYAQFKHGGTIISRSVGYHSDGDLVVLKEDSTSDSDVTRGDRRYRTSSTSRLAAVHKMEQPFNMQKVEERGLRVFPGVAGPRGKAKHRRFRNQFFVGDHPARPKPASTNEADAQLGRAQPMTKEQYQELYTHRPTTDFKFYDDDGELHPKWQAFIEITESQQARLLGARAKPKPQPNTQTIGGTPAQRWNRLGRSIRTELVRVAAQRETFLQPVEERLVQFIKQIDTSHDECAEPPTVALKFDDGYHRLLCHGVVAYYSLVSFSETGDDGERYTIITAPKSPPYPFPVPEQSLFEYVTASQANEASNKSRPTKKKRTRGRKP